MTNAFERQLEQSGYLHFPLPLDRENGLEAEITDKTVLRQKVLWNNGGMEVHHSGRGKVSIEDGAGLNGGKAIKMTAGLRYDDWPEGARPDGHYSNFGTLRAHIKLDHENLEQYNRLSFYVRSSYENSGTAPIIAAIYNDGKSKLPEQYYREGFHVINLKSREWNHIVWEIPVLPRDAVTEVIFYTFLSGQNGHSDDEVLYYIDDVEFQAVNRTEHILGWKADYDLISYATAGYDTHGSKTAVSTIACDTFEVHDTIDGKTVYTGQAVSHTDRKGTLYSLDFSEISAEGEYYITQGDYRTPSFPIRHDVIEETVWKTLNFLFCERCGYPVPQTHGTCHTDMIAEHNGQKIIFNGGWHDAADLSQFAVQSFEITQALFEILQKLKASTPFYLRVLEEAEWGLDFIFRTRFGDGYRATSAGSARYTDGLIGNFDDIADVHVHNHPIDNFISAAVLAYAAQCLKDIDSGRAAVALKTAKEDYAFAKEIFDRDGFIPPQIPGEHTYPSGESLFNAMASVAASRIFKADGDALYATDAAFFGNRMLQAQEQGESGIKLTGFFYRDPSKTQPQHFNHQAREHYYMRALILLCETQPDSPQKNVWENAIKLYASYLKEGVKHCYPYAMLPSGVYKLSETEDQQLFKRMSFACNYDDEKSNWIEQIQQGENVGKDYYLRIFPVWHSFRGNAAVHLESGKAATMLGRYLKDDALVDLGREQIYWILGKNPFLQSEMYGMGKRYPQMYAMSTGEVTGELPVGMESYENEDVPYWPHGNNCTYKEIWTSSSRSLLWVAADLL